jgi:hypothetical protein
VKFNHLLIHILTLQWLISVTANYLGQRLLRVYIIYIMKFHNFSHELEMIYKYNNTQSNKMINHPIHEQNIYDKIIILLISILLYTNKNRPQMSSQHLARAIKSSFLDPPVISTNSNS